MKRLTLLERMGFTEDEILELKQHCGPYAVDIGEAIMVFKADELLERIKVEHVNLPHLRKPSL